MQKAQLPALLSRASSFQQMHLYNRKVVIPYLLASHGLLLSDKKPELAVCSNPNCTLTLEFDDGDQAVKEELEIALRDHDEDCQFRQIRGNLVNQSLFMSVGNQLYEEGVNSFKSRGVWLQLNPKQVLQAANISMGKSSALSQVSHSLQQSATNFQLQQFMQLDPSISRDSLLKVSSCVFLSVFGWNWLDNSSLICKFCGSVKDVRDYISPSEFSLMKVEEGFSFISSHKGWCCLLDCSNQFWKQILSQAALKKLESLPCSFSRSTTQIKLRGIQRKTIQIYGQYTLKLNELRRKLAIKRSEFAAKQWKDDLRRELDNKIVQLQTSAQQEKELAERLIKSLSGYS